MNLPVHNKIFNINHCSHTFYHEKTSTGDCEVEEKKLDYDNNHSEEIQI